MIILDSDLLIAYLKNQRDAIEKIAELNKQTQELRTTAINAGEILFGSLEDEQVFKETKGLLKSLEPISYTLACAEEAAKIGKRLKEKGSRIGAIDEMVAGTCKIHNAILLTRNTKHFSRIEGLKTEQW